MARCSYWFGSSRCFTKRYLPLPWCVTGRRYRLKLNILSQLERQRFGAKTCPPEPGRKNFSIKISFFFGQNRGNGMFRNSKLPKQALAGNCMLQTRESGIPPFFPRVAWLRLTRQVGTTAVATSLSRGVIYAWGAAFGQILVQSLGA